MKKFAKWLVMILVVSCICALTLFATGCGSKDKSAKSVTISDSGEIIVTYDDDTTTNLGKVDLVKSGKMENGKLVLTLTNGQTITCDVVGAVKTVTSIEVVDNVLKITYSDTTTSTYPLGTASTCEHKNLIYKEQVEHKMNKDGSFENGIYLELCPDCGYTKTVVGVHHDYKDAEVAPTCLEKGYTAHVCKVCDYVGDKTDYVDALGHKFVEKPLLPDNAEDWCVNGGYTVERCAVCDAPSGKPSYFRETGLGHISAAWTLITAEERDAAAPGVLEGKCDNCETLQRYDLPAYMDEKGNVIGEDYKLVKIERESCGEEGKAEITISKDGQTFTLKNVKTPKGNHTLNNKVVNVEKDGVNGVLMFDDDAAFTASKLSLFADKDLSCKESVPAQFTCEVCNKPVLVNVQKKHTRPTDEKKITTIKEVTCTDNGELEYACSECCTGDETVTEIVKALDHKYDYKVVEPTTKDGTYRIDITCTREGCVWPGESLKDLTDVKKTVVTEATCENEGTTRYEYKDADGLHTINQTVAKLAHTLLKDSGAKVEMPAKKEDGKAIVYDYNSFKSEKGMTWFIEGEATCKENINGSFKCATCEKPVLLSFSIPHTAPKDVKYTVDKATCTEAKKTLPYTCTVCGEEEVVDTIQEALGHIYKYTPNDDDEGTIDVTCTREGCTSSFEPIKFDSKPEYKEVIPASCDAVGSATYTGKVNGEEKVVTVEIPKAPHTTAHGKEYYSMGDAPSTDTDISLFADQAPACGEEPAMGQFHCAVCNKDVLVKVKAPHTKPSKIADENIVKATCTKSGMITYDCTKCDAKGLTETIDPIGHDLTATVENGYVVVTCKTEGCDLHTTPAKEPLKAWDAKVNGKNYYTEIAHKDADCGSDGYVRYSFTYTFTYYKTWTDVTAKTEKVEVEFKNLVADKVTSATGHKNFVQEEVVDDDGNTKLIDKIFTEEIERTIDGKKVVYIVKYKKCAECGAYILDGEPTVKPEEDNTSAAA